MAVTETGKNGESEIELDTNEYLSDLTVGKSKIYLSNILKIYELEK